MPKNQKKPVKRKKISIPETKKNLWIRNRMPQNVGHNPMSALYAVRAGEHGFKAETKKKIQQNKKTDAQKPEETI